jgi:hypothetical protein
LTGATVLEADTSPLYIYDDVALLAFNSTPTAAVLFVKGFYLKNEENDFC